MKKERLSKQFFDELRRVPIVQVACEKVGLSRNSVYRWRDEDFRFREEMEDALAEGEDLINDFGESQLISLIKEKNFGAVRYWLSHRHPKFKPPEKIPVTEIDAQEADRRLIEEMGLIKDDFEDENYEKTVVKIARYLREHPRP